VGLNTTKNRQIVDAAMEEFTALGFHDARMDAIAERANVSKRTIYKHFASKEALFLRMITLVRAGLKDALDFAYDPARPIENQLREIAEAEGRLFTSASFMSLTRLTVREANRDPALAALFPADEVDGGALAGFLADACAHGALSIDDPTVAAHQFKDLLKGRSFWPAVVGQGLAQSDQMAAIINETLDIFLTRYSPRQASE
jgi:TetR/AcrR family transcriptional regulator of autoinduction and epiphytic fitness